MTVCMKELSPNPNNVFVNSVEKYSAIIKGAVVLSIRNMDIQPGLTPKKYILKAKIVIFLLS